MTANELLKTFIKIKPITKGWSGDKKYCVTTKDGIKYLLRISPHSQYEGRKSLFLMLGRLAKLAIPMPVPVEFGTCDDGVYTLQSWLDGEDLDTVLSLLSDTEQYTLGLKAGEILRIIHNIPAPEEQEEWESRFNRKTDIKIQKYHDCGLRFTGDEHILTYIEQNRHLLKNRLQCFQHGDFHVGNLLLVNGKLKIIDFDRNDFGDPWEEFNRIVWSASVSPHFATGQIRGYFNGEPPIEFFTLLAFYIASNTLSSIYWAIPFGQSEIDIMMKQSQDVLEWFDNMRNSIPKWYLKDFNIQKIEGIPYKMREPYDFSFLSKYGKVFKVYDNQDSGNICFGISNGNNKYFIKYAGSSTDRSCVSAAEAITALKTAALAYLDLKHTNLVNIVLSEDIGGGYAIVFDWVDAICMGRMYPHSHRKFLQLPLEKRIKVFEEILLFHSHVAACGYIAIDFYDGSIMYDFVNEKTIVCDIDYYAKVPYKNPMQRLWGSKRFMSPEEFLLGADIDEVTNVYTMGATAFALFSESNRSFEAWPLNTALYDVVKKSVSDERDKRQQSIEQLIDEWRHAK